MNTRNIVAISFLVIALSIGYYFMMFLPKIEQDKLNQLTQAQSQAQIAKETNKSMLTACLADAYTTYINGWNSLCHSLGKDDKCLLYKDQADNRDRAYTEIKDECFKQYPQQ